MGFDFWCSSFAFFFLLKREAVWNRTLEKATGNNNMAIDPCYIAMMLRHLFSWQFVDVHRSRWYRVPAKIAFSLPSQVLYPLHQAIVGCPSLAHTHKRVLFHIKIRAPLFVDLFRLESIYLRAETREPCVCRFLWCMGSSTCITASMILVVCAATVGHTDSITCCGYSFDGRLIATGAMDSTIRLFDGETGEFIRALEGPSGEIEVQRSCVFRSQGILTRISCNILWRTLAFPSAFWPQTIVPVSGASIWLRMIDLGIYVGAGPYEMIFLKSNCHVSER